MQKQKLPRDSILDPINLDEDFYPDQFEMLKEAFEGYALYCRAKAEFIRTQEGGYREWCEEIYDKLPEVAKWRNQ